MNWQRWVFWCGGRVNMATAVVRAVLFFRFRARHDLGHIQLLSRHSDDPDQCSEMEPRLVG